jgi:formiminotetrahydrofolate cyclodeaminase
MEEKIAAAMTERTIGSYLEALSNGAPTPGGGSAAGLAGALGCALGSMVCNLTLARESSDSVAEQQRTFLNLQRSMLNQAEADERVFGAYREAAALPRGSDDEKRHRREAIERTLVAAADVPLELATLGLEALSVLRSAAAAGTPHALGDLQTAGFLLQAMVLGSLENIEANAMLMKAPENAARFRQASASAREDLATAMNALESSIAARLRS